MTDEEAGEELLAGQPYVLCSQCQGHGDIPSQSTIVDANHKTKQVIRFYRCNVCFGKGTLVRHLYHEAARLMGSVVPPQPPALPPRSRKATRFSS